MGILPRLRTWLLGERNPSEQQLRDLDRYGARTLFFAHLCAAVVTVLFSLDSLIALGSDPLNRVELSWSTRHALDVTDAITCMLILAFVLSMDVARLLAGGEWRRLYARHAARSATRMHSGIVIGVAATQALMFLYTCWKIDHLPDGMAWALAFLVACQAPVLSIYLSLRRRLPVSSEDIRYQAELASSRTVVHDVVTVSNDASASLDEKMALYTASANMTPRERERLEQITAVARRRLQAEQPATTAAAAAAPNSMSEADVLEYVDDERDRMVPPSHDGLATAGEKARSRVDLATSKQRKGRDTAATTAAAHPQRNGSRSNVRTLPITNLQPTTRQTHQSARANAGRSQAETEDLRMRREAAAEQIMSANPDIGTRELGRSIAVATGTACSESTAHELYQRIRARSA